jgi:hypothetical protein
MKNVFILLLIFLFISFLIGCTYMSEEKLVEDTSCDTINLTYTVDIQPIFENNCYSCHSNTLASGGFNSENIEEIYHEIDSGKLLNAINRVSGYPQMPKNLDKLPDCVIKKIEVWNSEGRIN